jgi:hypothetical protein
MAKKKIIRTEEEIAELRAKRAEKKAKEASQKEFHQYFPDYDATKEYLRYLASEIRSFRKRAVEQGITKVTLPEQLKRPYHLAFTKLAPTAKEYNFYRNELGDLSIEGLKIQDREVKVFTYHYNDKLMNEGFFDWGWIIRMLSKKYVSRYGWALLRRHADKLSGLGLAVLKPQLDEWATDPKTQENWARLAKEDGKPADMRELLATP